MSAPVTTEYRYITRMPGVCGGRPIIKGTRTPVKAIELRSKGRIQSGPQKADHRLMLVRSLGPIPLGVHQGEPCLQGGIVGNDQSPV